jgi:hypothetical protein
MNDFATLPLLRSSRRDIPVSDPSNLENQIAFLELSLWPSIFEMFSLRTSTCLSIRREGSSGQHSARTKVFPVISTLPPNVLLSEMVATLELGVLAFLKHPTPLLSSAPHRCGHWSPFFFSFRRIERRTDTTQVERLPVKKRQTEEIIVLEHFNDSGCAF